MYVPTWSASCWQKVQYQAEFQPEQAKIRAESELCEAQAAEQDRLLTERNQLDASRKSMRAIQAELNEDVRRNQESLVIMADGKLGKTN